MPRSPSSAAALLLALLAAVAAAGASAAHNAPSFAHLIAERHGKGGGGDEQPAPVAFRYHVMPDKRKAFLEAWRKHEAETQKEADVVLFDLKYPLGSNSQYVGYGEWKNVGAYAQHYCADHTQAFLAALAKADVPYTLEVLDRPQHVGELRRGPSRGEDEKRQAHVLVRYTVHPSATKDFLEAWDAAEKGTEDEKGAHIYSLRQLVATNTEYYAYGTWADMKDYQAHFESDHLKQLRDTLDKHNVVWRLSPLVKVGKQPG